MKTIKIRALWFHPCKPKMRTVTVDDEFFDQIPCGIPVPQLAQLVGLEISTDYVRRFQIQYEGKIIYSSPNRAWEEYHCDSKPW